MTAPREVTDDDIETIAAEWAVNGQPTLVEVARVALESSDPVRQEAARQRCVDAIEARRSKALELTAETLTEAEKERIWADAYSVELRRRLDDGLRPRVAQYGARAHARLVLSTAINARAKAGR